MTLTGFGNYHQSEALSNALPTKQNSPKRCNLGLYAEQLSGSAFTRPRHANLRSWLYRLLPSASFNQYQLYCSHLIEYTAIQSPNPHRWSPFPIEQDTDFIDSLFPIAGNSTIQTYLYRCQRSMQNRYFINRDGEMLFVPYEGEIAIWTEFGIINLTPGSIAVVPRGVAFKVELLSSYACGYICENGGIPLTLPSLGIMGANALANPRHFVYPDAAFEDTNDPAFIICKYQHHLWSTEVPGSPLNVVAWHGNYAPYSYDLSLFNTINTVSFDHPDPSIFTVLTSESDTIGVANLDFVIFPPRWMVAENTFRPPYFHRNIMSELMGLIKGSYDAKSEGFLPGGISIHNAMTPHGPDYSAYTQAVHAAEAPIRYEDTLAFMLETKEAWNISEKAMSHTTRQLDYATCWNHFPKANIP